MQQMLHISIDIICHKIRETVTYGITITYQPRKEPYPTAAIYGLEPNGPRTKMPGPVNQTVRRSVSRGILPCEQKLKNQLAGGHLESTY